MGQKRRGSTLGDRTVTFRLNQEESDLLDGNMQRRGEPEISSYFRTLMREDDR